MYHSSRPAMVIDVNTFNQLKQPIVIDTIKITSESSIKSYNDLYHTFLLPLVGDYSRNFMLLSDYILKGCNQSMINVDCLSNYIDSVTLSLNNRLNVVSYIDNFPRIETLTSFNDKLLIKLEFLNLPLLTKCCTDSFYMVTIKFKQTPPINYHLSYEVMFVNDPTYSEKLSHESFMIIYVTQQTQRTTKTIELICDKGKLCINVIR
jgi:hypothetical protein